MKKSEAIEEFAKDLYDQMNEMLVGYGAGECSIDRKAIIFLQLKISNFILDFNMPPADADNS